MSCEMPKVPCLGPVPPITEFVSPGDSGRPAGLVEQKFKAPCWEQDWVAGECETWGNSTIVYLRAARNSKH